MVKQSISSVVLTSDFQSATQYWVIKNSEVLKEDFDNLWIISRLFAFEDWKKIRKTLEDLFQSKIIIYPLFAENVLIKLAEGSLEGVRWKRRDMASNGSFSLKV